MSGSVFVTDFLVKVNKVKVVDSRSRMFWHNSLYFDPLFSLLPVLLQFFTFAELVLIFNYVYACVLHAPT